MNELRSEMLGVLDTLKDGLVNRREAQFMLYDAVLRNGPITKESAKMYDEFENYVDEIVGN